MARSDAVLERLNRLHPKSIDLSLGRVERLLEHLGHPERALPPVVHAAGTNAKGSVIAYMAAALRESGYLVHTYTSPHLVRFAERISLAGETIDEDALTALLEDCERATGEDPITFFEITTAAAFKVFAETPADIVLLETGLGGRLDATNLVAQPALTVITPVAMDHQAYLGDTLEKIAFEKAGILKRGVPCVMAAQAPEAQAVIESRAHVLGAPLIRAGHEFEIRPIGGGFTLHMRGVEQYLPRPALAGAHQIENAGLAAAALDTLSAAGFTTPGPALARALKTARWPGRLQRLARGPWLSALPAGSEIWIDGGHNGHAAAALAAWAADTAAETTAAGAAAGAEGETGAALPLVLVCGMLNTRPPAEFLAPLAAHAAACLGLAIPGEANTHAAEDIAAAARNAGLEAAPVASPDAAIEAVAARAKGPVRVLICGSLYLAGRVLAAQEDEG
ncbi:MAG: bifunctional folylpolyglutamate synthase/dihydrofolate synthase [Rhodospirillales bacterium]